VRHVPVTDLEERASACEGVESTRHAKLVQELFGHATVAVTLDTYSHVLPGIGEGLADAMDEALGRRVVVRLR
jgi:integrase